MWNRRQRELWLDRKLQDLQAAREAYVRGTATEEQLEILRNEKIGELERQEKQQADEQKLWSRTKRFLFDGLKKEDVPDANSAISTTTTTEAVSELVNNQKSQSQSTITTTPSTTPTSSFGILEAVNAKKAESGSSLAPAQPGSLDVLAMNAENTTKQSVKSWTNWLWGR